MEFLYTKNLLYLPFQDAINKLDFCIQYIKKPINMCNYFVAPLPRKEKHAWL